MGIHVSPIDVVLATLLAIALYTDLSRGKIYNKITFPCIAIGLLMNIAFSGWAGAKASLAGIGLGAVVFVLIALLARGLVMGGDAKLLWAIGALKGFSFLAQTLLFTALAGGVLALLFLIYRRLAWRTLSDMASRAFGKIVLQAPIGLTPAASAGKLRYSLAIAAGAVVAFVWMRGGGTAV